MTKKIGAFFDDVARVFMPPFAGLPAVMLCYFIFSYIAVPHNPVWFGDLPDPDDYTYLSQTLDWLQGQNWFDNIQHRMSPPEGVPIHYTRLAEMPIAAVIMLFRSMHYSWQGAAMLCSFLLPVIYLGVFFAALRFAASRLIDPAWARLTAFIVLFGPALMFKFAPGQVDHHGLEVILTMIALGFTFQVFARPAQIRWAVAAGFTLALALAIALEVLPWVALTSAVIGLWTLAVGAKAARPAAVFGVSLFLFSGVFLAIEKPPAELFQPDLLAYSIAYVALTGGIALALLAAAAMTRIQNIKLRFIAGGLAAIVLGALYLAQYPSLLAGPYGAMDQKLAALFFANLEEAVPLSERYGIFKLFLRTATSLLGFAASVSFLRTAADHKKWGWLLLSSLLGAALALSVFYQSRVLIYALLFSVIPLAAFAARGWAWVGIHYQERKRFWTEIGLVMLLGPLTAVFLPALQDGRSFSSGVVLFPAQSFDDSCQLRSLERLLNAPPYVGRALRIVNVLDQGPELLFRTAHTVMSAPYHTNVRGNLDALDFFSTTDAAHAREIARRDGINLVVLCRSIPDMYLHGTEAHYVALPTGEIKMRPDDSFAGQLAFHKVPEWLSEIPLPSPSNILLFEVK